jgi:hypothetical protein
MNSINTQSKKKLLATITVTLLILSAFLALPVNAASLPSVTVTVGNAQAGATT